MTDRTVALTWHRVATMVELPEGRVQTVTVERREQFENAITRALGHDGPATVQVRSDAARI